ncbi:hypothetical protein OG948_59275 (plasmid) [Embleya sp. NBC_00888]|uniref:hypothetical protein n=1 Tax=Embleya sp. NBC_00888 TaxID=2975960 RepID=UPI00386D8876|nr:hypothetical protein OG948_59275 [Embleya sp. NBC_00888]
MSEEAAARSDEELRAMHRRLELLAQKPPDPALEPVNQVLNSNLDAFVLERLEGLNTPGRHIGLDDLVPGLLRPDLDPQLMATINRMFDQHIETIAERIRRGETP